MMEGIGQVDGGFREAQAVGRFEERQLATWKREIWLLITSCQREWLGGLGLCFLLTAPVVCDESPPDHIQGPRPAQASKVWKVQEVKEVKETKEVVDVTNMEVPPNHAWWYRQQTVMQRETSRREIDLDREISMGVCAGLA
jgi:hypothetical protein